MGVGIGGVSAVFGASCESAQCLFFGVCFLIEVLLGFGFFVKMGVAGHFRTARDAQAAQAWSKSAGLATARSGVYMVSRRTDSVIRFGFL